MGSARSTGHRDGQISQRSRLTGGGQMQAHATGGNMEQVGGKLCKLVQLPDQHPRTDTPPPPECLKLKPEGRG